MPCYYPIKGYRSRYVNPETGKRGVVFNANDGFIDMPVTIPCGRCRGCRLEYSRQWAIRCVHESQMHESNSFITLTYAPENLPKDRSISKREFQLFMKRLRKSLGDERISYFGCGEYGEQYNRPHYHIIIFGYDFPDKYIYSIKNGIRYYRSNLLERVWTYGYSIIGDVTFESCAYVSRYVMKKLKPDKRKEGEDIKQHYSIVDPKTGEIYQIEPEFCLMSKKPAIGKSWLEKYQSDTDKDFITFNGKKMKLPKYYDLQLDKLDQNEMMKRKSNRRKEALKNADDNTPERLRAKEIVKEAQTNLLKRSFENET